MEDWNSSGEIKMGKYTVLLECGVEGPGIIPTEAYIIVIDTESDKEVYSSLWQDPTKYNNQPGGHGFTGLNIINEDSSTKELQFWCEIKK